jgi:hypothetical protein
VTGTELAFRLPPGSLPRARALAERLSEAAPDAVEHVLFADDLNGEYGCLAVWHSPEQAAAYTSGPVVVALIAELSAAMGKPTRVRTYAMEYQRGGRGT